MPFIVDDTNLVWFCFPLSRKRCATTNLLSLLLRCHQLSFVCSEELESYSCVPTPSFPFPVHHFRQPPAVPHFPGQNLVLDLISSRCYSVIPLTFCPQLHDLLHLCCRSGKAPALLAHLCPLLDALVFHSLFTSNFKWLTCRSWPRLLLPT